MDTSAEKGRRGCVLTYKTVQRGRPPSTRALKPYVQRVPRGHRRTSARRLAGTHGSL